MGSLFQAINSYQNKDNDGIDYESGIHYRASLKLAIGKLHRGQRKGSKMEGRGPRAHGRLAYSGLSRRSVLQWGQADA